MQIISGTIDFKIQEPTAVVLGKFDGVHVGHRLLLEKLIEQKKKGLKTVVFTFDKSPASLFIQDGVAYRELCTLEEKRVIFEAMGVDVLIEFPMNGETAAIPAIEFITEILQKDLNCKILIAGEDVSFGYRGLGDKELLLEHSEECGYQVDIVEKLMTDKFFPGDERIEEIGSTGIRKDINEGKVARANVLMGRPFMVKGEVVHGRKLAGGILDMPTANIKWPDIKVLPAFGVYFTEVLVKNKIYHGVTNVGQKPTVTGDADSEVLAETYLYDFAGDLYGEELTVRFCEFVRPEQKFDGLEELKAQLKEDLAAGREYWTETGK